MVTVGIDMSKNSPGVCIRRDDKLSFLSFIRSDESTTSKSFAKNIAPHYANLRNIGVTISCNPRNEGDLEYSESEIWKLEDAVLLSESIVKSLPDDVDMIGMEGFSYGSKGNSGLDIAGYAYCVRASLYKKFGTSKLSIFSPGAVKKKAGKGNAGKEEIMRFFMSSGDPILQQNLFWKGLKNQTLENKKPIDDLVDAYYVQECAYEKLMKIINTI